MLRLAHPRGGAARLSTMVKSQSAETASEYATISREEIVARAGDRSLVLVDVMPANSFKAGHIPGAINLPLDEIAAHAGRVLPTLSLEIVIYCAGPT
jgi:rhodanese-related sulfurtransferase